MKRFLTLAITGAVLLAGSAFGATINPYTDSTAFANATALYTSSNTETFNTATSSIFTLTQIGGGLNRGTDTVGGKWYDGVLNTAGGGAAQTSNISLIGGGNMYGVSGTWDLSFLSSGGGVKITLNLAGGGTQTLTQTLGNTNSQLGLVSGNTGNSTGPFFFGFTSDVAFTSFTLSANLNGITENYTLDNLTALTTSPVPEPATFGLMGLALVGLGFARRSRR